MSDTLTYYTITQVAEILGVSPKTVRRRIADGAIAVLRDGPQVVRISDEALRSYIRSRETAAVPQPKPKVPRAKKSAGPEVRPVSRSKGRRLSSV